MPHSKCVACKLRLFHADGPADLVGDLCPGCGSLLESVGELAELDGFRTIKLRGVAAGDSSLGRHERIAGRVDDFFARRAATDAQARLDAEPWLDDGGRFRSEAAATAPPTPEDAP